MTRLWLHFGRPGDDNHGDNPTLRHIGELKKLTVFHLYDRGTLTEESLMDLAGLSELEDLSIRGMEVGDIGAFHISGLGSLKSLHVEPGVVTDAGLADLAKLHSLEYLNLQGQFTDEGLRVLKNLRSLRRMFLSSPHLTEQGLRALAAAVPSIVTAEWRPYEPEVP